VKILTFSIIFIYSSVVFSNACQDDPFGEESLFSSTLSHQKTQTQGGLGTCYANALSVSLGAEHGENISYQQLALIGSSSRAKNIEKIVKGDIGSSEMFVEGGDTCSTFDAMKKSKKNLCLSKDFPLENIPRPKKQGETFEVIGRLYQRLFSLPKDDRIKLARELQYKSMEATSLNLFCQNEEDFEINDFEFEKELKAACINNSAILKRYSRLSKTKGGMEIFKEQTGKENSNDFLTLEAFIGRMKKDEATSELTCKFNPELKKVMKEIKSDINKNASVSGNYLKRSEKYLEQLRPAISKLQRVSDSILGVKKTELDLYLKNIILDDIENVRNAHMCKESTVVMELYSFLEDDRCHIGGFNQKEVEGAGYGMLGLLDLGMDLDKINNLLNSFNDFLTPQNYFMSTLGGNCDQQGIKFNKNLKCVEEGFPIGNTLLNSKEELKNKSKIKFNKIYKNRLLKNKRPLVVSLCTGFLKESENEQANYSGKNGKTFKCDNTKKHGLHSMNIVGHRCIKGKIEYEILNSWGAQCGSYNDFFKNSCDPETGRFFIPEEMLLSNTFELEYLK
jgi:hypothetical protein